MEKGSLPRLHLREVGRAAITARGAGGAASFRPCSGLLPAPPPRTRQPRPQTAPPFPRPQSTHRPDLRLNLPLELRAQMRSPLTTHQPLPMLSVELQKTPVLTHSLPQYDRSSFTMIDDKVKIKKSKDMFDLDGSRFFEILITG